MKMKNKDFLQHFGILGMRWGRRKGSSGGSSVKKTSDNSDDTPPKKTPTGALGMSDQQLKEAVARLQLEKQYKDLTKKEVSNGRKIVNEILTNSAKAAVGGAVTGLMTKGLDKAIAKALTKTVVK